jgi:hypothetical protein
MNTKNNFKEKLMKIAVLLVEAMIVRDRRSDPDTFDRYVMNKIRPYGLRSDYA